MVKEREKKTNPTPDQETPSRPSPVRNSSDVQAGSSHEGGQVGAPSRELRLALEEESAPTRFWVLGSGFWVLGSGFGFLVLGVCSVCLFWGLDSSVLCSDVWSAACLVLCVLCMCLFLCVSDYLFLMNCRFVFLDLLPFLRFLLL